MPLRDHFRPPLSQRSSWEGFHAQWPAVIIQDLRKSLPPGYIAEPRVHLGSQVEIDMATFEQFDRRDFRTSGSGGGVATAVWTPAKPNLNLDTAFSDSAEYEVRIYDTNRDRQLVAAIELVSPANLDRPEHRRVFVGKCADLLQKGVAVSIVDIVTNRLFNMYADLLTMIGHEDQSWGTPPPWIYAASCRVLKNGQRSTLQAWSHRLELGAALPTLPLWLDVDSVVPLHVEAS